MGSGTLVEFCVGVCICINALDGSGSEEKN